jgi:hypothetical protein
MSYSYGKSIVTDGLVFYVDAANSKSYDGSAGGTTWTDLVGDNNGTLTNMDTNPASGGYVYDSGNGGSIVFDGTNDYVNLYSLDSTDSFTINFFFKTTAQGIKVITGMYNGSGADWWIGVGSDETLQFSFGSPSKQTISSTMTVDDGVVRSTTCVYDKNNNSSHIYINGILQNTATGLPSSIDQPGGNLTIGCFGSHLIFDWPGNIYSYKIYNKALTSTEITQNYNALKNRFV